MVERDHDDGSEGRAWETSTDRYWLERVLKQEATRSVIITLAHAQNRATRGIDIRGEECMRTGEERDRCMEIMMGHVVSSSRAHDHPSTTSSGC